MVELAFVQQLTVLTSILLAFSFPAVAQLALHNAGNDGTDKGGVNGVGNNGSSSSSSSKSLVSAALIAFILCATSMGVATFIGGALSLILSHYQARPQPISQNAVDIINTLLAMWRWPVLIGILSFLIAFTLLGWIRSRLIGIIATIAAIGAVAIMIIVWIMISSV